MASAAFVAAFLSTIFVNLPGPDTFREQVFWLGAVLWIFSLAYAARAVRRRAVTVANSAPSD